MIASGGYTAMFTRMLALPFAWLLVAGQSAYSQTSATVPGRERTLPSAGSSTQSIDAGLGGWQGGSWLNSTTSPAQDWRLGVRVLNSETGVVIREVTPNGAGDRARLEVGDTIVAVGGYQVGMIDGRLFDVAEELRRRADTRGNVSMLVQDHRTGQLSNLRLQLDSSQASLKGEMMYRERIALPVDAIVTVQIENVTRPFAVVRGGQISFRPSTSGTIPFEVAYDPTYINPQDIYQVRAYITSGGRTIFDSSQTQRVITQGNPSQVRINLVAVPPTAGSTPALASTTSPVVSAGYPNYNAIDDQIISLYRKYLNRMPTNSELAALRFSPNITTRISSLPIELMAAQEYFDAAGNNNQLWLQKVFTEVLGRAPTQPEFDQWMKRYADLRFSRTELLRQLYSQATRR
jgi:uncharacterized lipoprotein YbaY